MPIEAKDLVSGVAIIVSASIAVGGWLKAAQQERKHHRFQRRVEKRLWMLESVAQAIWPLTNLSVAIPYAPELRDKLAKAELNLQLFGFTDEQGLYRSLLNAVDSRDSEATRAAVETILPIIQRHLRDEMGFPE